jgi:diguanylate cyclase (GGDEF)-like protein
MDPLRNFKPLLFAILDIDHFKHVNDHYGHQAGDVALQAFASLVQSAIRGNDILARWGGEEFVILFTETDISVGLVCLERIRTQVAEAEIVVGGAFLKLTVSMGVTQYCRGETIEKAMARADAALYSAKAQGRNQIVGDDAL